MRKSLIVALALLGGCGSSGDDDDGGGGSDRTHPSYLVGSWEHDEGREGYADYADFSITLNSDGHYVWQYGPDTLTGTWEYQAAQLRLDGSAHAFAVAKNCRLITLDGKTYLGSTERPTGCPSTPAPLSALEKCVVGRFTGGTPNNGTFRFELAEDRTIVEFWDDPGYTSGGSSYTRQGEFTVDPLTGDVTMTVPDGGHEVRTTVGGLGGRTRSGAVVAGCDMAAYTKLVRKASCTRTCASDRVCSEDADGTQTCCPNAYPYFCHDLDICFGTEAQRDGYCPTAYYGDPAAGCASGQVKVTLTGATGSYCAPRCNGVGSTCPSAYNGLDGACLITSGTTTPVFCALSCTDIGVAGGQCPAPMTCRQTSSGNGFCLH